MTKPILAIFLTVFITQLAIAAPPKKNTQLAKSYSSMIPKREAASQDMSQFKASVQKGNAAGRAKLQKQAIKNRKDQKPTISQAFPTTTPSTRQAATQQKPTTRGQQRQQSAPPPARNAYQAPASGSRQIPQQPQQQQTQDTYTGFQSAPPADPAKQQGSKPSGSTWSIQY